MDLAKIKERLNALNNQTGNQVSDYDKYFWKVPVGKSTVRIVPSKYDKDNPFTELLFHSVKGMFRGSVLSLSNFGKQDPIEEFRQQLQSLGGRDNWSMSGKLTPRPRWFVPVVVRGEEDKGVRLWGISSTVFKALCSLAADEEIGDFTDIVNGTDMIVEKTQPTTPGAYPEISVRAKRNSSTLSDDPKQVESWLNEQPEPIKCFREYDYDFIKKGLQAYLTGGVTSSTSSAPASNPILEVGKKVMDTQKASETVKEETKPSAPAKPKAQSVTSKFDDLFGDSKETGEDIF